MQAMLYLLMKGLPLSGGQWDFGTFLTNASKTFESWGGLGTTLIGIIVIGFGVVKLAKKATMGEREQTSWAQIVIIFVVGGLMTSTGGFGFFKGIAQGQKKTIEDLGKGSTNAIIMHYDYDGFNQ